jgi:deoxyribodipyrimidine photo-lyase
MTAPVVMWFRRDLRCEDHAALAAAAAQGEVIGLFIADPAFVGAAGSGRESFMWAAVKALSDSMDGALTIAAGDPVEILTDLVQRTGTRSVFVSRDYTPYGRARDARVAQALGEVGARLHGVGSNYLVDPGQVRKASGDPYAVFTPFSKVWRTLATDQPVATPQQISWATVSGDSSAQPDLPSSRVYPAGLEEQWFSADRSVVATRWEKFCKEGLGTYHLHRDLAAIDGTSRLSAALRWGLIHPRQLMADLTEIEAAADSADLSSVREGIRVFSSEIAWREFYADVLFHQPITAWRNLNPKMDAMRVDTDQAAQGRFERWAQGRTGFGIVDAGMRQLLATGWMHNRVRMIVASFLVKDLHLPWQWGARHFMTHLVDGDLASNQHGWQWAAGTGTDAAPYFRVFNPHTQMERYDPDGAYCARWIPEWGTDNYLEPMVDHGAERQEALARYSAIRS